MRTTLLALALLLVVSIAAARWSAPAATKPDPLRWVRTADGWERRAALTQRRGKRDMLSPWLVAGFQLTTAGLALAAGHNDAQDD
ncbi:MAG: hypothetical protein KDA37_00640 [Planctomycetales bacterium]|nr:hypothetical protein [Planctomycetales bacterium]